MASKEARDLKEGDVEVRLGMQHHRVVSVTPIGDGRSYVEVKTEQVGNPANVTVTTLPSSTRVNVLDA